MIDGSKQIDRVTRSVADGEVDGVATKSILLSQTFNVGINELWDAITNKERLIKWFAPVSGDLQLNGKFQVENNANGTITSCDAPNSFDATWEFGDAVSWIEVRLSAMDENHAELQMSHITKPDEHWRRFGPGAGGVGWDYSLLGLASHLESGFDATAGTNGWESSPDALEFARRAGSAWVTADIANGEDLETAQVRGINTVNFYTGATEQ